MALTSVPFDPSEFAQRLGHSFQNAQLLTEALTHPSFFSGKTKKRAVPPFERLEFLGDRVLGLIIAEWLYKQFPESNEGELAKRHASLVNREALRAIAQEIGLSQYLRLAKGEEAEHSRKNQVTLADALEAVIGALYLDGGLSVADRFIHQYWQRVLSVKEAPDDPKTSLQEWAQGRGLPLPSYRVVERTGPAHEPKFLIEVHVKGIAPLTAEGDSKRAAEKSAAARLLEQLQSKR